MEMQQNIANMMRALKEANHKSMAEFSQELEISRSSLQDYLNGTGNPSIRTVEHIADKLGINPLLLVCGSFQADQTNTILLMLNTTKEVMSLPEDKRRRFAELFAQIVSLWEYGDC